MSRWTEMRDRVTRWLLEQIGYYDCTETAPDKGESESDASEPAPDKAVTMPAQLLASCWDGGNAQRRMMNIVSPRMSEERVVEYIAWMRARGCNTAHVILCNAGDGECAGYDGRDAADAAIIRARIEALRNAGLYVVPWIMTDDSSAMDADILAHPSTAARSLIANGLLDGAGLVVLGLEMDEVCSDAGKWRGLRDALTAAGYAGEYATHHTSGHADFAALGAWICDQLSPSCTTSQIAASVKALRARGLRVIGFEYARQANASKAKAALDAGAVGVGNYDGGDTPTPTPTPVADADEVPFSSLDWCWGGFAGGKAALGSGRISSLRIGRDNMSYTTTASWWRELGNGSATEANSLACLFVRISGKWQGGKIDWISESRASRSYANIRSGYHGWRTDAIEAADDYAFVIVSRDGKRRTNVITKGVANG